MLLVSSLSGSQPEGFGLDGTKEWQVESSVKIRPVLILGWQLSGGRAGGKDTGEKNTSGRLG